MGFCFDQGKYQNCSGDNQACDPIQTPLSHLPSSVSIFPFLLFFSSFRLKHISSYFPSHPTFFMTSFSHWKAVLCWQQQMLTKCLTKDKSYITCPLFLKREDCLWHRQSIKKTIKFHKVKLINDNNWIINKLTALTLQTFPQCNHF